MMKFDLERFHQDIKKRLPGLRRLRVKRKYMLRYGPCDGIFIVTTANKNIILVGSLDCAINEPDIIIIHRYIRDPKTFTEFIYDGIER